MKVVRILLSLMLVLCGTSSLMADDKIFQECVDKYVTAFNEHNLDAISAMWSENAVVNDLDTGDRTVGRAAIVADLAAAFKAGRLTQIAISLHTTRLISADVASLTGQTTLFLPDQDPTITNFVVILVKKDGLWLIDSLDESPAFLPPTPKAALQELNWLVGAWAEEGGSGEAVNHIRWSESNAFLLRTFVMPEEDGTVMKGTQVIGWDPRSRQIRSWAFLADGTFGDGVWSKNGEDWIIKSSQTMANGNAVSGTYIMTKVDDQSLTIQLVARDVEGEPQPATPQVKMVRLPEMTDPNAVVPNQVDPNSPVKN
jgi:uncharacterized protein (TIGR02246 family)